MIDLSYINFGEQKVTNNHPVFFTTIKDIQPHNNADKLSIATVYGFQVVVRLGQYQVGDSIFFVPVDSILPQDLYELLFPSDAKIKLDKRRVRQCRIRKFPSQGMIVDSADVDLILKDRGLKSKMSFELEQDYAILLGIEKYNPPEQFTNTREKGTREAKPLCNPLMQTYNGITNMKWFPDMFKEDEDVVVQEKIHGSNIRLSYLPSAPNTLWKKFLKLVRLLPSYEYCWGSNNVELTNRNRKKNYYGRDVYLEAIKSCDGFNKLKPNELVYGEVVFEGCQKNYHYGHKTPHLIIFDVKVFNEDKTFKWLSPDEVEVYAKERGFDFVPILYKGKFNRQLAYELSVGPSVYYPAHKVREGAVVKSQANYNDTSCASNRRGLKIISTAYLDDVTNSDNH